VSQRVCILGGMVLVAPRLPTHTEPGGTAVDANSGREVLALLRGDTTARPNFDPALAGGMRAWLEDAAYDVVSARGEHAPPLVLGPRQVLGNAAEHPDDDTLSDVAVLSRLVHALFRQIVTAGVLGDPLPNAIGALRAMGSDPVPDHVEALPQPARAALADHLEAHARTLEALVPRLAPGWMPRTDDYVAVPLAGGRVVLHGVFDLLVGLPRPPTAALCAVGLSTGGPWAHERRSLHYLALLETLRSGTPPFRLALLDSASGRYGVEDVREEHLRAVASHIVAWLGTEVGRGG
jgi:hypothetical protein